MGKSLVGEEEEEEGGSSSSGTAGGEDAPSAVSSCARFLTKQPRTKKSHCQPEVVTCRGRNSVIGLILRQSKQTKVGFILKPECRACSCPISSSRTCEVTNPPSGTVVVSKVSTIAAGQGDRGQAEPRVVLLTPMLPGTEEKRVRTARMAAG